MSLGQLRLLKQIISAGDGSAWLPLERLRENFERFLTRFPAIDGLHVEPVVAGGVAGEWLDVKPAGVETPERTLLYLHGGGFVVGSSRSHRQTAARLARAGGARWCLVLDYRLAPEHPYPAAVEDAVMAYRWLLERGGSPGSLAVAGDSAGGGLAVLALTRLRDEGAPLPACAVAFSPWVDYAGTTPSLDTNAPLDPVVQRAGLEKMAAFYLDGADPWHPEVTPLAADLKGLPPLLIQAGGAETLVDDSRFLARRAELAGLEVELEVWPDMIHVWQVFAGRLEEADRALDSAGRFLSRHWE